MNDHDSSSIMPHDLGFIITEGVRTLSRQQELVRTGASQTVWQLVES